MKTLILISVILLSVGCGKENRDHAVKASSPELAKYSGAYEQDLGMFYTKITLLDSIQERISGAKHIPKSSKIRGKSPQKSAFYISNLVGILH